MATREVILDALKRAEQEPQFEMYRLGAESPEQRFERQQAEKDIPDPTLGETVKAAVTADSIVNVGVRETIGRLTIETDPEYVPPDPDSSEFAAMVEGVPEQYWPRLASARSAQHAQYIKQNILEELDAMDTLSRAGWGGVAARVGMAVLDPPALALALATGGASLVASGGRAARAAKLAAAAGAENVTLEASLLGLRETKDEDDLYYALIGGVVAGGTLGAILPKSDRVKLYEAGKKARDGEQLSDKVIVDAITDQSGIEVYHGSPFEFDRFDVTHIGRGEGAQAFGHGLYFAESPGVAGYYAKSAGNTQPGNVYRVKLNVDPDDLLDWDKPLSQQSEKVKAALAKGGIDVQGRLMDNGADLYRSLVNYEGYRLKEKGFSADQQGASEFLRSLGIPGIRYLDQGSRDSKQGTRNFVVFDDTLVRIVDKNGVPIDRSVGAQQATRGVDDLGEPSKEVLSNAPPKLSGVEAKLRYDWHAQLMKSDNPYARYAANKLVADPVGQRGVAQEPAAEEFRRMLTRSALAKFARPAYRAAQEALQGVPLGKRQAAEDEFYKEVTQRVIREQFDDTPAGRAAAGMADAIEATAQAAKRFGVPGFDTLELRRGYVPHIPSGSKLQAALDRFGSEQVERTLAEAFARASGVEAKYARRIAKGYITGVRNRHAGVHSDFYLTVADHEMVADLLRKAGIDDDEIAETVQQLKVFGEKDTSKAGKPARAKRRLAIDETYVAKLKDQSGEAVPFSVMELFETDARFLTQLYASTVGGHAAMARAGFKGQKEWDAFIREMQQHEANALGGKRGSRIDDEVRLLQQTRDYLLGRPLIDYSNTANAAIFAARDWAFIAQSGSFWAAQGSELMAVMTSGGLRMTLDAVPQMKSLFTRAADGTLDNTVAREIESLLAPGVDALLDSVLGRFSVGVEEGAVTVADKLQRTYGVRHNLKRLAGYANLLTPLTTGMQRVEATFVAQRVLNELMGLGGKGFSEMRLRTLGLTPEMEKRVAAQLKQHVKFDAHGIPRLNAESWTDLDARDAFALAVQRETDRTVLSPTLGASIPFTRTNEAGKALTQFMTFAIQAHTRLLLHGIKHADAERFTMWLLGTGMAAMLYVARTHIESVGKKDRRKFLRERLAMDEIAKAAFARSGFSALIPTLYDTAAQVTPAGPAFSNARTSGLGSGLHLKNVPAGAVAVSVLDLASSLKDGQFTQSEWRNAQRMLPFARVMGIQQGLEILGRELPERAASGDE